MTIPGPELGGTWLCRPQEAGAGKSFLGSALAHLVLIVVLAVSQGPQIRQAILARRPVATLVAPAPARPATSPAIPQRVRTAMPALPVPARLPVEARPVAQKTASLPAPPPMAAQAPAAAPKLLVEPALPPVRETVRTGVFASAASGAPATRTAPEVQTATAGFTGVTAQTPVRTGSTVAAAGFPSATAAAKPAQTGTVATSSFGDAAQAPSRHPAPAAVANGGFGEATTARGPREGPAALRSGGFGDARTAAAEKPHGTIQLAGFKEVVAGGALKPGKAAEAEDPAFAVAILQKPRPAYTEEARALRVEGEVWLEVLFSASGKAQILRVVKRLGHGLDESAIQSAAAIRFRPAQRNGAPVDSIAIARIVFQLAY